MYTYIYTCIYKYVYTYRMVLRCEVCMGGMTYSCHPYTPYTPCV